LELLEALVWLFRIAQSLSYDFRTILHFADAGFILFMGFVLVSFNWFYFIHSMMVHRASSVFATPGV